MTPAARLVRRVFVLVGAASVVGGCAQDESPEVRRVVAYVSADPQTAGPILQAFEVATGIRVDPLYDTEATKTTGLAERLRRESGRPRADVFWSSEPFAVEQLAAADLLAPISHPDLAEHPRAWRRHDDRWFAFAGRARVIAFRPDRVVGDDVPTTWQTLAEPRWRDEIAMADPRFGTTRGHIGALAAGWGDEAFSDWLDGLAANRVRRLPGGNAATVDAVVRGEVMLGLTDTDDVLAAQARGLTIDAVLPRHLAEGEVGGGTLLVPNAAGVVAGAPHVDEAIALVAFLASPRVERMLRNAPARHQPVAHPQMIEIIDTNDVNCFDEADPWRASIEDVSAAMDAAVAEAMERFDRVGAPTDPAS